MAVVYKCPSCGEDMIFDVERQMLHCKSCGRDEKVEEAAAEVKSEKWDVNVHTCPNCGAQVMTDDDTTATSCAFCGAPTVIPERLTGELAPAMVIPFKYGKSFAEEAFMKWCKKGLVTPRGYFSKARTDSLSGIYVPFFLYDCKSNTVMHAQCTTVRTWRSGNKEYTETRHFDVLRDIDAEFLKVPVDASVKMDDELMDKLEPFNYGEMVKFSMPYLSGYLAEKHSDSENNLLGRMLSRVERFAQENVRSTISGYSSVQVLNSQFTNLGAKAHYVLLPVWVANYDYKGKKYTFAMNGQTGKVVGKPPISVGKALAWFFGITAAAFLILLLIGGLTL